MKPFTTRRGSQFRTKTGTKVKYKVWNPFWSMVFVVQRSMPQGKRMRFIFQMKEGTRARGPIPSSVNSLPLIFDIEDFKIQCKDVLLDESDVGKALAVSAIDDEFIFLLVQIF